MAHSTLHFATGMLVASAAALPRLVRAWRGGLALADRFAAWFILSFGLGIFAVTPALLRRLGVSPGFCDGWWMNVFLFYPLMNKAKPGAETMGPMVLGACFACQYFALLAALHRRLRSTRER